MDAEERLKKYLDSLLRHGYGESWICELTFERVATLAALANNALIELAKEPQP